MKRPNFDILDENHDITAYERHYTSSLLSTCKRRNSSPAISSAVITWSGIRVELEEHPLRILWLPFTIAGKVLLFYNGTRNTLRADLCGGGEWSASRAKENIGHFGIRIWRWIYVEFIWHLGIWHHDHNHIVTTNAQNNYILFEFCLSVTNEQLTNYSNVLPGILTQP